MNKLRKTAAILTFASLACAACDRGTRAVGTEDAKKRIQPEYDKKTGKLTLLKYDANGNGKVDTWSYMDGARIVRIEIDTDEDGTIDRWEYYGADQKLEKIGFSRLKDGKEDAWSYTGPDGSIARIEVSTHRDGKVTRVEHYHANRMVSAEEDSDGDGKFDKWETYADERLAAVSFDTTHRGTPDRRIVYGAAGSARMEIDRAGDGHFVAIGSEARATNK